VRGGGGHRPKDRRGGGHRPEDRLDVSSMWMGLDAASSWSNLSFQPARVPSIFVFLDGWILGTL